MHFPFAASGCSMPDKAGAMQHPGSRGMTCSNGILEEDVLTPEQNKGAIQGRRAAMQYGMPTLIESRTLEENAALCQALRS